MIEGCALVVVVVVCVGGGGVRACLVTSNINSPLPFALLGVLSIMPLPLFCWLRRRLRLCQLLAPPDAHKTPLLFLCQVLSGNQPEACFAKYGSMPTHSKYLHENALRILLHALDTSAARYRRYIQPVLSCGIDFYVRVFVRVFESPSEVG